MKNKNVIKFPKELTPAQREKLKKAEGVTLKDGRK